MPRTKSITSELSIEARALLRLAAPLFIAQLAQMGTGVVDTIMAGRYSAEDLAAIASMGFRGEALPSIASVSRFTLTTRERDSDSPEGTQVIVNGGRIAEVKAAGSAPGTSVEVRRLFFNLPARRKSAITDTLRDLGPALAQVPQRRPTWVVSLAREEPDLLKFEK